MVQRTRRAILASPPEDARLGATHHVHNPVVPKVYPSLEAWLARAEHLRRHILTCAGLWPLPERCPLEAEILGARRGDGFTVSAYRIQTLPGFWACGNLFIPEGKGPFPAVLNPHGHWPRGRLNHDERGSVPARGVGFARLGAVALTIDMVGYNDSDQVVHRFDGPAEHLWGFGPFPLQLWNLVRALDFLQSLDFVDPERIGCTGASGGGTQTFFITAIDERVKVAAPVNMISAHMHGGCVCENAPMLRIDADNMEIAALAAPRPMLMVSATGDWTVNTPRVEFPAVQRIYALFGHADRVETVQVDAPHNYNAESRAHVYRFFARHLLGRGELSPKELKELEAPLPCTIDELRLYPAHPRPHLFLDQGQLFDQVKREHRQRIAAGRLGPEEAREQLLRLLHWRAPRPDGFKLRVVSETEEEIGGGARVVRRLTLGTKATQQGIPLLVSWEKSLPLRQVEAGGDRRSWPAASRPPRLVAAPGEPVPTGGADPILCCVEPFLTGSYLTPLAQTGRNTGVMRFEGYNLTDDAWRVLDIVLASVWLERVLGSRVHLEARGAAGAWGLAAAALSESVASAELELAGVEDDEESLVEHLYVPHLMRLGGLEMLLRLCAPRPLTLRGASPSLAERARAAYAASGAGERLATAV